MKVLQTFFAITVLTLLSIAVPNPVHAAPNTDFASVARLERQILNTSCPATNTVAPLRAVLTVARKDECENCHNVGALIFSYCDQAGLDFCTCSGAEANYCASNCSPCQWCADLGALRSVSKCPVN